MARVSGDDSEEAAAQPEAADLPRAWGDVVGQLGLLQSAGTAHATRLSRAVWGMAETGLRAARDAGPAGATPAAAFALPDYLRDASERYVLFLDTLRRSADAAVLREAARSEPVLAFDYDLVIDGKDLERPVNYELVRIRPPEGYPPQREGGRPWVIIDPRAGQGSGIGGLKDESEVGAALRDGHPVYFVIFRREPEPGQTLADVCAAEAQFLREIRARHPMAPQPLVTGNCQGGWAAMILAATHPDLVGPLVIAGAPLSYWAGQVGRNPFRYLGGVMGGALPAMLLSDLGAGTFDGAWLVHNFETLNPGLTYWRKHYDLYADDTSAERFMAFDRWWSGFYFMTEAEIRWIVENLFVGNRLVRGTAVLDDGTPVDLTRIKPPVVVFASHGDNITPPQQALNWIPDLYPTIDDLRAKGHVIVYTLHDTTGHLGIFVSAKVASRQHRQITSVVKTIEALAPGLYEMIIDETGPETRVTFEARTIDDILALGDGREEEKEFEAVALLSDWLVKTYELAVRPAVRAAVTPQVAERLRALHPKRQQITAISSGNPVVAALTRQADAVRARRRPADPDNPFRRLETVTADLVGQQFDLWRDMQDAALELSFHALYATPWMKSHARMERSRPRPAAAAAQPEIRDLLLRAEQGGYPEAILRMLILLERASGQTEGARLESLNDMLQSKPPFGTMSRERRGQMLYEQSVIVDFAGKSAVSALPVLLRDDVDRIRALSTVYDLVGPADRMSPQTLAAFRHLQSTLRALAHNWHDPDRAPAEGAAPEPAGTPQWTPPTDPAPAREARMETNRLPRYDDSVNTTGCCPKFDPEGWDGQVLHFENKAFVRATTRSAMHVPVNMRQVFDRVHRRIEAAGAHDPDNHIVLSRDLSPWQAEHLFPVSAPVPGEDDVTLTGDFITKVFEGPYRDARHRYDEMQKLAHRKGTISNEVYFFYTTCPKCAKAYGRNYVVGVARIDPTAP